MTTTTTALFYRVAGRQGRMYTIRRLAAFDWRCECRAFAFGRGKPCRHILAAQGWFIAGFSGSRDFPVEIAVEPLAATMPAQAAV